MNLYLILYDGQSYYVEAPSYRAAIDTWTAHARAEWGDEFTEEPESCALLNDAPVLRSEAR